jgi:hypothetical protein
LFYALSLLSSRTKQTLFDHLDQSHVRVHGIGKINLLSVVAFMAVEQACPTRIFAAWLACDFGGWLVIVMLGINQGSAFAPAMLSYASGALVMIAINFAIDRSSYSAS